MRGEGSKIVIINMIHMNVQFFVIIIHIPEGTVSSLVVNIPIVYGIETQLFILFSGHDIQWQRTTNKLSRAETGFDGET